MDDKTLVGVALCMSAAGIILLLVALSFLRPDVDMETQEGRVTVRGIITTEGETVTIAHTVISTIDAPAVRSLKKDDCVIVSGRRNIFNGKAQIDAERIERCE